MFELWFTTGLVFGSMYFLTAVILCGLSLLLYMKNYVLDQKYEGLSFIKKLTPNKNDCSLPPVTAMLIFATIFTSVFPPSILVPVGYFFLRCLRYVFRTKKRLDKVLDSKECIKDYKEDKEERKF